MDRNGTNEQSEQNEKYEKYSGSDHNSCISVNTLTVAKADYADAEQQLQLLQEAAEWMQRKGIDMWRPSQFSLEQQRRNIAVQIAYKAVNEEGELYGSMELHEADPFLWGLRSDDALYVHKLAVRRDTSGKGTGFGLAILRWAEAEAGRRGRRFLRLDCMGENVRLNDYYREAGFSYCGRREGRGWSAHLYEKEIENGL